MYCLLFSLLLLYLLIFLFLNYPIIFVPFHAFFPRSLWVSSHKINKDLRNLINVTPSFLLFVSISVNNRCKGADFHAGFQFYIPHHNDSLLCTILTLFSHSAQGYTALIPVISQDCCMQLFLIPPKFQNVDARVHDDCNSDIKSMQCYQCLLDLCF